MATSTKVFEFYPEKISRDFPIVYETLNSFFGSVGLPWCIVGSHREVQEVLTEALDSLVPDDPDQEEFYEEEKYGFLGNLNQYCRYQHAAFPEDIENALCEESDDDESSGSSDFDDSMIVTLKRKP